MKSRWMRLAPVLAIAGVLLIRSGIAVVADTNVLDGKIGKWGVNVSTSPGGISSAADPGNAAFASTKTGVSSWVQDAYNPGNWGLLTGGAGYGGQNFSMATGGAGKTPATLAGTLLSDACFNYTDLVRNGRTCAERDAAIIAYQYDNDGNPGATHPYASGSGGNQYGPWYLLLSLI